MTKKEKKERKIEQPKIKLSTKFINSINDLADQAGDLKKEALEFKDVIYEEYVRFEQIKINLKREQDLIDTRGKITEDVVDINIGGRVFTTFKSTLTSPQNSLFTLIFNNKVKIIKDMNGIVFIDRPPKIFDAILDGLRNGILVIPEDEEDKEIFEDEISFYGFKDHFKQIILQTQDTGKGFGGTLLTKKEFKQLDTWIGGKGKWKLIYKASKDGFDATKFRSVCSNKGPTITVVQSSNGYIFGGYTPLPWSSNNNYAYNASSFIFSFKNANGTQSVKLDNNGPYHSSSYSIYNGSSYGPTFGGGHDFYLCSGCNSTNSSYSNLGHSYSLPGFTYGTSQIQSYLAGSYNFTTTDYEVFCQ